MKKKVNKSKAAKSNKGAAVLKKIVAAAKKIRKSNPGKKWTSCIKAAAKARK